MGKKKKEERKYSYEFTLIVESGIVDRSLKGFTNGKASLDEVLSSVSDGLEQTDSAVRAFKITDARELGDHERQTV